MHTSKYGLIILSLLMASYFNLVSYLLGVSKEVECICIGADMHVKRFTHACVEEVITNFINLLLTGTTALTAQIYTIIR